MSMTVVISKTQLGCEYAAELCKRGFKIKSVRAAKAELTIEGAEAAVVRATAYASMKVVGDSPEFKFKEAE